MNEPDRQGVSSARLDLILLSPEVLRLSIARDAEAVERLLQLSVPPLALMKWAYEQQHVPEFIVSIAPDNIPSRRLAEGLGFIQVGSHPEEGDGPEDIFRLRYPPAGAD